MKYLFPLLILFIGFSSCQKRKARKQAEKDEDIIQQYIANNNLAAIPTGTGLYYVIETQGTGISCTSNSTVVATYKGYYTNGVVFDESPGTGVEFSLQNVIEGWKEGVPYFKEGGVGKLLIPSALGYGPDGTSSIPKNSVLIFDIGLLQVL